MASASVNIATAHNIVVSFDTASLLQRIAAWLIDAVIFMTVAIAVATIFSSFGLSIIFLLFLFLGFYDFAFEVFNNGQSPGKMLLKLRVISLKGTTPDLNAYFIRWIFRMLDIGGSFGILAMIFIGSSDKSQRLGDLLAETTVVNIKSNNRINIRSIEKETPDFENKYPGLSAYKDQDMLVLKHAIRRYKYYPTAANRKNLVTIKDKIISDLDLRSLPQMNLVEFTEDILKTYVLSTR